MNITINITFTLNLTASLKEAVGAIPVVVGVYSIHLIVNIKEAVGVIPITFPVPHQRLWILNQILFCGVNRLTNFPITFEAVVLKLNFNFVTEFYSTIAPDPLAITLLFAELTIPVAREFPAIRNTVLTNISAPALTVKCVGVTYATNEDMPGLFHATVGTVLDYNGGFLNDDGHLDSTKRIQDSYYYQQFSYVLKTGESASVYKKAVLDFIHPAGMLMFGSFSPVYEIDSAGGTLSYNLFKWIWWNQVDVDMQESHHMRLIIHVQQSVNSFKLGPSLRSIERDKFYYRPSSLVPTYFSTLSSEQISWMQFLGLNITEEAITNPVVNYNQYVTEQFATQPWLKTNYSPEPVIKQTSSNNMVRLTAKSLYINRHTKNQVFLNINDGTVVVLENKKIEVDLGHIYISDYNTSQGETYNYFDQMMNQNCALWLSPVFVNTNAGAGYPYVNRAKTSGKLSESGQPLLRLTLNQPTITV